MEDGKIAILGLIGILVLVVATSGCTSQSSSGNKYSANGVLFTYPSAWSGLNSTDYQNSLGSSGTALALVGNNTNEFGIAKLILGSDQQPASLSQWASNYNSTLKSNGATYVSEKSLTVDGVPAYQITAQVSNSYVTDVFFVKNVAAYLVTYASTNNDQQTLEQILNTLKIT